MRPSTKPRSFAFLDARFALLCILILTLVFAASCKKKGPHPESASGNESRQPASGTSYLPQDIFGPEAVPGATVLKPVDLHSLSESETKFGVAPQRSSAVEYQPDVIIMEHGDKAIRSISSNGMEWEFDANAEHVSEFQEGKIVFATGRSVGRIISLKREGGSVKAILGPIQITDVIKNGKFKMDSPVSADNMISYVAPDYPQEPDQPPPNKTSSNESEGGSQIERAVVVSSIHGGIWTPMSVAQTYSGGRRVTFQKIGNRWVSPQLAPARLDRRLRLNSFAHLRNAAFQQQLPGVPGVQTPQFPEVPFTPQPPAKTAGTPPTVDVGDIRTVGVMNPSYIGVQFYSKNAPGGLAVFAEALMDVQGVHLNFDLDIVNGAVETCGLDLGGALGVTLHMDSHTTKDFQVNLHKKWWVPIDLSIPIGLGSAAPVPFSVTFNMMLNINTGFSAKQSILTAEGDYTYTGGLWAGYKKSGGWQVTSATNLAARTDMGRSIQGISVGINSLAMAASIRAMVGIGAFGFNTGVYIGMRFDGTLLRQADITFPCKEATIGVFLDSGVGYSLPGFVVDVLNKLLSAFTKYQIDRVGTLLKGPSKDLFHGYTEIPAACASQNKGGG